MSERVSALGSDFMPGIYGDVAVGAGVTLTETIIEFLGECAAFHEAISGIEKIVAKACRDIEGSTEFKIASNRWFLAGPGKLQTALLSKIKPGDGSLTDLTHGRTSLLISGPKAEWVLSKLFAIDFGLKAFPVHTGLATTHHDIFAQIFRRDENTFDLFVYRSFAHSFWHTLCRAAEETGYEAY